MIDYRDDDSPRDACGVFGIWGHPHAVVLTHYGLYALQHRGQESAGMAVRDECGRLVLHRGMGLVADVFDAATMSELSGSATLGHVRYSTTGSSALANAQPLKVRMKAKNVALAHNGNLVNAEKIRDQLESEGSIFQTTSDTEVIAHLAARAPGDSMRQNLLRALQQVQGAYGFAALTSNALFAARDPHGIRPLSLGRLENGWVVASETCALDAAGATFIRDVAPGEMLIIDDDGINSVQIDPDNPRTEAFCIFEHIYFARPDSNMGGINVHQARKNMGRLLAQDHPVDADVVTGVPDSSLSAATGYAEETRIPYEMGLVRNRYIGRTFIQPGDELRQKGVRLKLNPLLKVVQNRRVVLVDDSIVRGTTSKTLVRLLREAGAREVHLRISSPPYRHPCYFGIDTSTRGQLIATDRSVDEVQQLIGADSLAYLSGERVVEASGGRLDDFCMACFTGNYCMAMNDANDKLALEVEKG